MLNSLNFTFIAEARSNFHDLVLPPASAPAQSPKAVEPILAFSISAPRQIYSVILGLHCRADQFTSTIGEVL